MRDFLALLLKGATLNQISKEHTDTLKDLERLQIVKIKNKQIRFDSSHRAGILDISRDGTGYLQLIGEKNKDLLVESCNLNGASKEDLVIVQRVFKKRGRPQAKVVYVLERKRPFSVAYLVQLKQTHAYDLKTDVEITLDESKKALKNLPDETVVKVENGTGKIVEVLGVLSDPKVDEKISLALFNKKELFEKKSEREAEAYGVSVDPSQYPKRTDLSGLDFCTIDPPTAKDHDDAIYFDLKECTLYVAIADVSEYVTPHSNLDKEAKARGFSIYLPHKSIPMLPRALSENICSLKEDELRLAFIYKARLHKRTLQPIREEFFEGLIRSRRKYSYDRVDLFLEGKAKKQDSVDKAILEWLLPLSEITAKLRAKRLKSGYDFVNDEVRMELDKEHNLLHTHIESETPSHSLIEECMLLANKGAARSIKRGIYRIHEEPSREKIDMLLSDLSAIGIYPQKSVGLHELILNLQKEADKKDLRKYVDRLIIKSQKQASYSHQNVGHFGLGFEDYAHFTSPIRRYSDLILHRILKAVTVQDEKHEKHLNRDLESVCVKVSELEREAAKVEWDYQDRKYVRWAQKRIGDVFDAVVVETGRGAIAEIEDRITGARVFLQKGDMESFEKVRVEISEVHLPSAKIFGRVMEM